MTSKRDAWASEKIAIEAELREEASRKEKEARDMLEKQFAERERQATEEMSIAIRRLDEKAEKESLASAQLAKQRQDTIAATLAAREKSLLERERALDARIASSESSSADRLATEMEENRRREIEFKARQSAWEADIASQKMALAQDIEAARKTTEERRKANDLSLESRREKVLAELDERRTRWDKEERSLRQEAKTLCDKMIADAKAAVQNEERLLKARVSEIQLMQTNEERKRETASTVQQATLKEARALLRKKAEEIDLARDALLSKKKQQEDDAVERDRLFKGKYSQVID
jgi:hypothetical protein